MTCLQCVALDPRDRVAVEKKQSYRWGRDERADRKHKATMCPHETPRLLSEGGEMGCVWEGVGGEHCLNKQWLSNTPSLFGPCLEAWGS